MDKLINISGRRNVGDCVGDINANFEYLDNKAGSSGGVTVDTEMSTESTNPVQNKVVTKAINDVTNAVNDKVPNSAEGVTELLDNLVESETTPGNEDYLIIKSLKQYTLRPFTTLWNWIKSNLAKVATSGSYSDLTNKPDIPTVDSSFSESGTNAVAGNTILAALNSKANKTELQALSNQVGNKIDESQLNTALASYRPTRIKNMSGTGGTAGYVCFAQIKVTETYINKPIEFVLLRRGGAVPCRVSVRFKNVNSTDPAIDIISIMGASYGVYAYKSDTSTWQLYAQKSETYDNITLASVNHSFIGATITYPGTQVNVKHTTSTDNPVVSATWGYTVNTAKTADNATLWNGLTDDTMTANTTDTRLMVLNGNKVQHRQIDTLPFLSSDDLAQPVLYTSTTATTSATITGLFDYSLIWFQAVGSKTTHTHVVPLRYLKTKGELIFKDNDTPFNLLYVSDTQIRWFEYQGSGAETYSAVTIVKIL